MDAWLTIRLTLPLILMLLLVLGAPHISRPAAAAIAIRTSDGEID